MINQQLIKNAVKEKVMRMTLHAIVNECFLGALPFDQDELTTDDVKGLSAYSKAVLESLITDKGVRGGVNHLTSAMESATDPRKKQFLTSIYTICNEMATKVSKRVSEETQNAISLEEILDNAGLNEDEIKEFKDNVSSINPEKISEVIQNKVVDTIKTEQEEHEEAERLSNEIKDAIAPEEEAMEGDEGDEDDDEEDFDDENDDVADEGMEEPDDDEDDDDDIGYDFGGSIDNDSANEGMEEPMDDDDDDDDLDQPENPDDDEDVKPKKANEALNNWYRYRFNAMDTVAPTSLFGKIEDFAMEAVLHTREYGYSEIPFEALDRVTFNAPLHFIYTEPNLDSAVESLLSSIDGIAMEGEITADTCDKSMLISTIVYTILETLKTLNIYCPSKQQIQSTVNAPTSYAVDKKAQLEIAKDQVAKNIKAVESVITHAKTKPELGSALESLSYCRDTLNVLTDINAIPEQLVYAWDAKLQTCEEIAKKKLGVSYVATESAIKMEEQNHHDMLMELNKINRYYGTKPNIDIVEIHYNSAATESYVPDVIVRDNTGRVVDKSFLDLKLPPNFGLGMENLIKVNYPKSRLSKTNKLVRAIDHGRANYTENIE